MTETTNPLDAIKNLTNSTPSTTRFWVCPACRFIEEIDMAKALPAPECPGCKTKVQRVARPTAESAQEAIKNLENAARLKAMNQESNAPVSTPPAPAPAPVEPKLTAEPKLVPEKVEPAVAAPAAAESRGKRKREKPAAEIPAPLAAAQPEPAPEPEPTPAAEPAMSDAQAARAAAIEAFIAKHKLNSHTFTRVSTGRVHTFGFTRWLEDDAGNRKPLYLFRDIADSGEYAESLKQARASDGSVATDVVTVTGLSAEVRALVWNGELVASLRDGTQTHGPKIGSTVHLGAKVSRTGRLVWAVMGVA